MPRGKQFGYIFLSGISKNEAGHVIAHELGHGLWKLKHTFDDSYGKTAAATEGTTDNLMDYNKGSHLAKWQWDMMREPAIFDGVFDSDEEGMFIDFQKLKDAIKKAIKNATVVTGKQMLSAIILSIYVDNFMDWNFSNWNRNDILDLLKATKEFVENKDIDEYIKRVQKIILRHNKNDNAATLMNISQMSFLEQLELEDVSKVENNTQQMISSNKDASTVIFGLLFEFKYGVGHEIREFDENSVLTQGILDWSLVEEGREHFYKLKYPIYIESLENNDTSLLSKNPMAMQQNGGDGNIYNASFTPVELVKTGLNLVRQYFGGFYMEIFPDTSREEIKFIIYNDVNLKFLVFHYLQINELTGKELFPEKYPRVNGQITPLGETRQILKWKEPIDNKRFEKYINKK